MPIKLSILLSSLLLSVFVNFSQSDVEMSGKMARFKPLFKMIAHSVVVNE